MASMQEQNWDLESGDCIQKETSSSSQTPSSSILSSSFLRRRPNQERPPVGMFKQFLNNLRLVFLGTKLCVLIPAIPLAILGQCYGFMTRQQWIFALSLLGLAPLAERMSFLTEQIAYFTGPTVGGLLNATCGNATELILALFALRERKILVLKYSLLGSVLSNLLLVLGSSLFLGGLANLKMEQTFDRKQADVNSLLLLLGLLCHVLPLIFGNSVEPQLLDDMDQNSVVWLSRTSGILMLVAYGAYLFFQLRTHRQFFEAEGEDEDELSENEAVIGFWSAFIWLVAMTIIVAILSEYVVGTIEAASDSWKISVSFISLILLPIVGNAAEHAGSVIFALKNKLDITLGVALGSATQISMFVVPVSVIVAWTMGIPMDLDFGLLETSCLGFSIILTAFTLQDGNSHYIKGVVLCLSYAVIAACFFFHKMPASESLYQR
ncbi:vacuolar cation/proton exchanger 3 isoform X4 [Coffea arabica]|uniref:Vacuolar cation/proton exchanger n=1 Tax=Coffea arabica TaxID=13443 RepID=A0ABM4WU59_COFAR|nr:vacuolar cation/proton exchanger 3-like isoform X2 [Coffea arabica]